jgi:hypothetical protein
LTGPPLYRSLRPLRRGRRGRVRAAQEVLGKVRDGRFDDERVRRHVSSSFVFSSFGRIFGVFFAKSGWARS